MSIRDTAANWFKRANGEIYGTDGPMAEGDSVPSAEELDAFIAALDGTDTAGHNRQIDAQIVALEQNAGGYNRGVREFMLGTVAIIKQLGGPDASGTPGMVKVKQLDDQIKVLRAQRLP